MIFRILSYIALGLTIVPPIIFFNEGISIENMKLAMIIGAVLWFPSAILANKSQEA